MKVRILTIALILAGLSACTQKTCPTYAKSDVEKGKTEEAAKV